MTIRENGLSHIPFHTAAEPTSAPSGHLLPGEGGSVPPPASSFRAKARNLFRSRSAKRGEDGGSRETSHSLRRGMPIRERTVSHSFSSRLGSEPPLFRGTSFQGKEVEYTLSPEPKPSPHGEGGEHSEPDRVLRKRERTTVSSLRFTRVPERRSHPLSSLPVEDCPCGADLSSAFGAPLLQGAAQRSCKSATYENTASPLLCIIAFSA